jgi:hypothetical protein
VRGLHRRRRAVVERRVGDLHAGQLADHGLVLEDHLERALRDLGLVRRVGRRVLGTGHDRAERGRDEVIVDAAAEEAGVAAGVGVPLAPLLESARDLVFRERRGQWKRALDAELSGNGGPEILVPGDADPLQHGAALGVAPSDEAHACAPRVFS